MEYIFYLNWEVCLLAFLLIFWGFFIETCFSQEIVQYKRYNQDSLTKKMSLHRKITSTSSKVVSEMP